eukprot:Clim_evm42s236 gene=Clim_evmTU42s236
MVSTRQTTRKLTHGSREHRVLSSIYRQKRHGSAAVTSIKLEECDSPIEKNGRSAPKVKKEGPTYERIITINDLNEGEREARENGTLFKCVAPIKEVHRLLEQFHGKPQRLTDQEANNACGRKHTILGACIDVILSANTSNINSTRAMKSFKTAFPTMADARNAGEAKIEEAIRCGGLSNSKARSILGLLCQVYKEHGTDSLEHLRDIETEQVKQILSKYRGLGPKTIACVLMFTMDRADIPVDTHVHRVSCRLGWREAKRSRPAPEHTYKLLNELMDDDQKHDMHVLLIRHGRRICTAQAPACYDCPVSHLCPSASRKTSKKELLDF